MIGSRFHFLTVIKETEAGSRKRYECRCDCGNIVNVRADHLKSGAIRSCGCIRRLRFSHGHCRSKESATYTAWTSMKNRVLNPNNQNYRNYGARGITVCKRWLKFENFLVDMGVKPEGLSLDRIDNEKGYCKKNCRWATRSEQQSNKRTNRLLTYENRTLTLTQWAKEVGMTAKLLHKRLNLGWSIEAVLTTPIRQRRLVGDKNHFADAKE